MTCLHNLPVNYPVWNKDGLELHYENPSASPESKLTAPEESDIVSNELLRPIFRIGSIDGSQDGDESGLRDVDQVFELKRRTSSVSSQGADGGHRLNNFNRFLNLNHSLEIRLFHLILNFCIFQITLG
jgi:hypothetical protein